MSALLWDKTLPWNSWFRDEATLPALKRAGYSVVGLTVGGGTGGRADALAGLDAVARTVEDHAGDYRIVREITDVDEAVRAGQLALELNFQGARPLEGRLSAVEEFWRLGVRQIGIVWNTDDEVGCSATTTNDAGLTPYGRRLVRELTRAGIIVDGTHASYRTTMDALDIGDTPIVFSHSNIDAIAPSYKNLKDDQIRSCAQAGGVIGIAGFGTYLDDLQVPPEAIFRQIDYVCELVGPQHVGLGLDFVRDPAPLWEQMLANPELWPGVRQSRFFAPQEVGAVVMHMQKAGYGQKDIQGILGENWKRVSGLIWGHRSETSHADK